MSDLEPKTINSESLGFVQTQEMTLKGTETENYGRKISKFWTLSVFSSDVLWKDEVLGLF